MKKMHVYSHTHWDYEWYFTASESIIQLIYHMDTTRSSKVNYLVVDREHLYDADIQKVLFPIVQ